MYVLTFSVLLGLLSTIVAAMATTHDEFVSSLSLEAEVLLPNSTDFDNASLRWNGNPVQAPQYDMIVKVATEEDVQKSINYANKIDKPFFAISGGHGTTSTIGNIKNGIGIHLSKLDSIQVVDNGTAALIGGGVLNGDLTPALWSQKKQTMTTGCDCVGYIAPVFGGGHGWLQGRYGKATDMLISARLVLADGTIEEVTEESNTDLFWAIRGAGVNFGIATQIKVKVFDVDEDQEQWAANGFVFTHDKMEQVFGLMNEWLEIPDRPMQLTHYGVFIHNPEVDPVNPIIVMWLNYQGPEVPAQFADPLRAIGPLSIEKSVTDLAGVNTHLAADRDGASCAKGFSRRMTPVSLQRYSLPALRKVLDIFATFPTEFQGSPMMLEGYPINRVSEIPSDSTAYPDRGGKLLLSPVLIYPRNASLDTAADYLLRNIRAVLQEDADAPLKAYVNYAKGDESMEEIYGYEPWRLEKLRRLKKMYDPHGRFNFYAPIV